MSQYFNKDIPFFDNVSGQPLAFGVVYFGQPNTDPKDQDNNAKAPFEDRELTVPADSVQVLDASGKLSDRLYLNGAYAITVTDSDGVDIDVNPYYVGESTDNVVNDSSVTGATLTDALNELLSRIEDLESNTVAFNDIWPVGATYTTSVNENPGSRLGFGTWVADSVGRAIVGVGTGTDVNGSNKTFAAAEQGGEYLHTLTLSEMPSHEHNLFSAGTQSAGNTDVGANEVTALEYDNSGNNDQYIMKRAQTQSATRGISSSRGDGTAHNVVQPYKVFYVWRRTA